MFRVRVSLNGLTHPRPITSEPFQDKRTTVNSIAYDKEVRHSEARRVGSVISRVHMQSRRDLVRDVSTS